ncbi:NAD(P)/FAD-dependent oxidoreductase [Streptomyces gilvus]|uniref:NAD(P)/FAD-dependent oxidoreductase n=1 Tax=Streptomyces gilvus TaxID=2920937 RepID=UPI001F10DF65|nr:FAD-dependent oxidoreductase [Streptomyces sp. CME 23]MCH5675607.1 FAD-dependent oxidoreductase [Streptomyces sp. CME 23]
MRSMVVVGGGHAGAEVVVGLRKAGFEGRVVLVADEDRIPYQRPLLSKSYLSGGTGPDELAIRPERTYADNDIELVLGTRVDSIDRGARRVVLSDGRSLDYEALALAPGGRPRLLPVLAQHGPLDNVHYLRTVADADRLREQWSAGRRLVVIGGGYIGLEVAASARAMGLEVTVVEALPRVLARVTGEVMSSFYAEVHRERGVDLLTGVSVVDAVVVNGAVREMELSDGSWLRCDLVVVGVGLVPNTELAAEAGLAVDDGIVVDEFGVTSDPSIVAAGDCARYPSAQLGGDLVRVESVSNAVEQARVVARSMVGKPVAHTGVPWFWSDQYELKLQMVGLSRDFDDVVVRGDVTERSFSAFYLREGRVIAADVVSRPVDFALARQLVARGQVLERELLSDVDVPLKQLLVTTAVER